MNIAQSAKIAPATAQPNGARNSTPKTDKAKAAANFDTFLKLLTTQLKNQDPLKPLDSTQFVAQLASFSAVEQQVRTNDTLGGIKALLGGSATSGLGSWVGLSVRAPRAVNFSGTPIEMQVTPANGADRAELVVRDGTGAEVQRQPLALLSGGISWAGVSANKVPFPAGKYKFVVESFANGKLLDSKRPSIYGSVVEARLNAGKTELVLKDGTVISADAIDAVRK